MDPWVVLKKQYLDEKCIQRLPPKNAGNVGYTASSSSMIGLEEAKKIYGSTGGFGGNDTNSMPPPWKPYVTASTTYSSYDSINGHNVPVCTAQNGRTQSTYFPQNTSQCPPYPPFPAGHNVTASTYPPPPPSYGSQYNYPTSVNSYTNNNNSNSSNGSYESNNSNNNSSSSARTHFLDGQGWYNQTASRAVNQVKIFHTIEADHLLNYSAIYISDTPLHYTLFYSIFFYSFHQLPFFHFFYQLFRLLEE